MKICKTASSLLAVGFLAASVLNGCKSTESDSADVNVAGSYYGVGGGFYDPWYYGPGYYPPDVIVAPPPARPIDPPHVEHPIALPDPGPAARPLPSIPSMPRVSPRR